MVPVRFQSNSLKTYASGPFLDCYARYLMIPFQVRSYGPCSTSQCLQDTYEGPTKAEVGVQADNNFVAHFRNERNHRLGQPAEHAIIKYGRRSKMAVHG